MTVCGFLNVKETQADEAGWVYRFTQENWIMVLIDLNNDDKACELSNLEKTNYPSYTVYVIVGSCYIEQSRELTNMGN